MDEETMQLIKEVDHEMQQAITLMERGRWADAIMMTNAIDRDLVCDCGEPNCLVGKIKVGIKVVNRSMVRTLRN